MTFLTIMRLILTCSCFQNIEINFNDLLFVIPNVSTLDGDNINKMRWMTSKLFQPRTNITMQDKTTEESGEAPWYAWTITTTYPLQRMCS